MSAYRKPAEVECPFHPNGCPRMGAIRRWLNRWNRKRITFREVDFRPLYAAIRDEAAQASRDLLRARTGR